MRSAGIVALAVSFPKTVRTNDYWRERHPEIVAGKGDGHLKRVWSPGAPAASASAPARPPEEQVFLEEMAPYLDDPFRGAVERRVLGPGETALSLELGAAQKALRALGARPDDIDLVIVSSFLPDTIGVGNAALLANALSISVPAWNLETACSSALVGLETACALVRTGSYRRVLVVISCTYSRVTPETDTLSFSVGDGAAAFIVGEVPEGEGLLGMKTVNTADHCGAMAYTLDVHAGEASIRMVAGEGAGAALRATSVRGLVTCCRGAAQSAGVELNDVDVWALPSPLAWYTRFCSRVLGFSHDKTVNMHPRYCNIGPVLMPANLYHAAASGMIKPGSLVMAHTVGIVSNASAAVMRWGNVAIGE